MAYMARAQVEIFWVGDGVGAFSQVPAGPTLKVTTVPLGGPWQVPGGDSPSAANMTTLGTTIGTAMGTALGTTYLAQIQGWSTATTQ